jgi:cysteinyl-tRNA synthetase, unknown class
MPNDLIPAGKAPQNVAGWSFNINNNSLNQLLSNDSKFLVIDYSKDGTEGQRYSASDLTALHQKGKSAVSYLSIGEAEDYRYYYQSNWNSNPPSWLGQDNPDWPGNAKVKYWDPEWQNIMLGYLDKIIESGFDGIYLDIVDGYEYWSNPQNGEGLVLDRADAANRMIDWVEKLAEYARIQKGKPDFYVIPQNGEELLKYDTDGSFLKTLSAVGVEDLYYNETSSQSAASIAYRSTDLNKVVAAGKPVLVIDYVSDSSGYQGNNKLRIDDFWTKASRAGYTPQVSSIDRNLLAYDPINASLANIVGKTAAPIGVSATPPVAFAAPATPPVAPAVAVPVAVTPPPIPVVAIPPAPMPVSEPVVVTPPAPMPVSEPVVVMPPAPMPVSEPVVVTPPAPTPVPEPVVVTPPAPMPVPEPVVVMPPAPTPVPEPVVVTPPAPMPVPPSSEPFPSVAPPSIPRSGTAYFPMTPPEGFSEFDGDRHNSGGRNSTDNLFGTDESDRINGTRGADVIQSGFGNDVIDAGSGNDLVHGQWDRDLINGGEGNDSLFGDDDSDTLIGGAGDDRLTGDRGYDQLTGGAGRDVFVFENFTPKTLGRDTITDFEVGIDKIELNHGIFTKLQPGGLAAGDFAIVESKMMASRSSAAIVYDSGSGNLFYNSNGTDRGFGDGTTIAKLSSQPNLSASDFTIV